jgi:hypothetical protein
MAGPGPPILPRSIHACDHNSVYFLQIPRGQLLINKSSQKPYADGQVCLRKIKHIFLLELDVSQNLASSPTTPNLLLFLKKNMILLSIPKKYKKILKKIIDILFTYRLIVCQILYNFINI